MTPSKHKTSTAIVLALSCLPFAANAQSSFSSCSSVSTDGQHETVCFDGGSGGSGGSGLTLLPPLYAYLSALGTPTLTLLSPPAEAAAARFAAVSPGSPGAILVNPAANLAAARLLPPQVSNFLGGFVYRGPLNVTPGQHQTVINLESGSGGAGFAFPLIRISIESPGAFPGLGSSTPVLRIAVQDAPYNLEAAFAVPNMLETQGTGRAAFVGFSLLNVAGTFFAQGSLNNRVFPAYPVNFETGSPIAAPETAFTVPLPQSSIGPNLFSIGNAAVIGGINSHGVTQYIPIAPRDNPTQYAFQGALGGVMMVLSDLLPQAYPNANALQVIANSHVFAVPQPNGGFFFPSNYPAVIGGSIIPSASFTPVPSPAIFLQGDYEPGLSGLASAVAFSFAYPGFGYNYGQGAGQAPNLQQDYGGTEFFYPNPATQDLNPAPAATQPFDTPTDEPSTYLTTQP